MARCRAQGYLYAVRPEGGDVSRIKIGSTMSRDPVLALHGSYDRGFGRTEVLWLMPCSDVRRDEKDRMHDYSVNAASGDGANSSASTAWRSFDKIDTFEAFMGGW